MTCPECGSPDKSEYHTTLDTLTPCDGAKAEAKAEDDKPEAPAKKPARKRTTKK